MNLFKKNYIWGYISQCLNIGINLLLLPFMVIYLDAPTLGLWFNFAAIGSLVMLLDFGFSITMSRNVSYAWNGATSILKEGHHINKSNTEPNKDLLVKIIMLTRKIYFYIGMIAFLLLITIGTIYIYYISKDSLAIEEYLIPWFLYISAILLNIFYLYWTPLLKGVNAMKEYYQILSISKLVQLLVTIIFLLLGFGLYGVVIAYVLNVFVSRMLSKLFFYKFKPIKEFLNPSDFKNNKVSNQEMKDIYLTLSKSVYKQGLLSLSNFSIEKSTMIICTIFFGLNVSSKYGLTIQAFSVISTLGNVMFNTTLPKMISLKTKGEIEKAFSIFKDSLKIQALVIVSGSVGIYFLGPFILEVINSKTGLLKSFEIVMLATYVYLFNFQLQFTNFIIMDNKYPMLTSYIVTALTTIILSIIFANIFNEIGVAALIFAQLCSLSMFNLWYWPQYVFKSLKYRQL